MWPFRKKYPPLSDLPQNGAWHVSQGTHNGRALLVRVNTAADPFRGHPDLSHQVGIAVPFKEADSNGMPVGTEIEELNAIEDQVFENFEAAAQSIVVAVVTTGGMREFVLYTRDPSGVESKYQEFKTKVDSGHEIQLMIQPDPKWNTFAQFR